MADYPRTCLLADHRGIYIPRDFITGFDLVDENRKPNTWRGIDAEDIAILEAGPDHEHYWDAWDNVLQNAFLIDDNGRCWRLEQDGDLFAVPDDINEWNADVFQEYFQKREAWNMEYVQSDDYCNDYAYLMSESDRINESVRRLLTKYSHWWDVPTVFHKQAKLIADDIAQRILDGDLFEHQICDEYSSDSLGYLDSFQIGEYEDQVDVKQLYEEIGDQIIAETFGEFCDALDEWSETQRDFCIRGFSQPSRNAKYPTVYLITYTGLRVDYVISEETFSELITTCICDLCRK